MNPNSPTTEMANAVKLPFDFDVTKIKEELNQFSKTEYTDIYNPSVTLETLWLKHLIVPIGGPNEPIKFVPNESLKKCPYLMSIFESFQCQVETFRIHTLDAGASIQPHRDVGYSFEHGKVRLHIPIQTNDKVEIILENELVKMKEGECWYCNFDKIHEVHNRSDSGRMHLILDCLVNEWLAGEFENSSKV